MSCSWLDIYLSLDWLARRLGLDVGGLERLLKVAEGLDVRWVEDREI